MNDSTAYIAIAIAVLGVIAILVFIVKKDKREKSLSTLAGLAYAFVLAGALAGLFFGENRWLGYGLMGIGIILAAIDIFMKSRNR